MKPTGKNIHLIPAEKGERKAEPKNSPTWLRQELRRSKTWLATCRATCGKRESIHAVLIIGTMCICMYVCIYIYMVYHYSIDRLSHTIPYYDDYCHINCPISNIEVSDGVCEHECHECQECQGSKKIQRFLLQYVGKNAPARTWCQENLARSREAQSISWVMS